MNIKTANRLCELRKKHNLSQEELAAKLGVSRQAVSKWERSESSPDTDNLILLASIYNISLDELINGEEAINLIKENNEKFSVEIEGFTVYVDDEIATIDNKEYKIEDVLKWKKQINSITSLVTSITIFSVAIAYLLLGCLLENGFANYWFLFILIPVPESIVEMIMKKKSEEFNIPCLLTAIYCAFGMIKNLWHPLWVIFLVIPLYYVIAEFIDKKFKNYKLIVLSAYNKYKSNQKD